MNKRNWKQSEKLKDKNKILENKSQRNLSKYLEFLKVDDVIQYIKQ